jgi:hypothetical protein
MSLFDTFLAQTELELIFTRRLMGDIESGALAPSWGMTREQALAFLADSAAERAGMIRRLAPFCTAATNRDRAGRGRDGAGACVGRDEEMPSPRHG